MKRLAMLLAVPLLLTGCAGTEQTPTPSASSAPPAGAKIYCKLDDVGIKDIKASKTALLDMTSGYLLKSSVGLRDGKPEAPDVHTDGLMDLFIEGPNGVVAAHTDRLRLNGMNNRADFSEVTYFLTADNRDDYFALIRDGVDRYGVDHESAERVIESISSKPEDKTDFAITPGTATGLQVTYDLRYDGAKDVQVIIVHVNPLPSTTGS